MDEIFCHLSFTNPTDSEIHIPFLKNGTITPIYSDFVQFYLDNSTESITPYFFNFFANEIIVPPHDTYSIEVSFLVPEIDFHIITAKTIYGDYTASFNVTETITIINEEEHYYAYIDENANSSIFYIEIYYPLPGPVTDWTDRCIRFRYSNVNDIENEVFVVRAFIKTDIPYLQGILEITANTTGTLEISFNAWPTYTVDNDVYFEVYKKESGLMLFDTEHILLM